MKLLTDQLDQLVMVFLPSCQDTETMQELRMLFCEEANWPMAHYLSARIRTKSINAFKRGDPVAEAQYAFEEVCAQTLYNLSDSKQPFGPDTPYWVIPLALKFAAAVGVDPRRITEIATG